MATLKQTYLFLDNIKEAKSFINGTEVFTEDDLFVIFSRANIPFLLYETPTITKKLLSTQSDTQLIKAVCYLTKIANLTPEIINKIYMTISILDARKVTTLLNRKTNDVVNAIIVLQALDPTKVNAAWFISLILKGFLKRHNDDLNKLGGTTNIMLDAVRMVIAKKDISFMTYMCCHKQIFNLSDKYEIDLHEYKGNDCVFYTYTNDPDIEHAIINKAISDNGGQLSQTNINKLLVKTIVAVHKGPLIRVILSRVNINDFNDHDFLELTSPELNDFVLSELLNNNYNVFSKLENIPVYLFYSVFVENNTNVRLVKLLNDLFPERISKLAINGFGYE